MATKREKKEEAKRTIRDTVPTLPIPRFFPAPLRLPNLVLRGTETLAQGLVELDPLGIITDDSAAADTSNVGSRLMMAMVNDPNFVMTDDMVEIGVTAETALTVETAVMVESTVTNETVKARQL